MKLSTVAGLAALLLAPSALAQSVAPPAGLSTQGESIGITPQNPSQGSALTDPSPAFHVFGVPVGISAPVNSPYMQPRCLGVRDADPLATGGRAQPCLPQASPCSP